MGCAPHGRPAQLLRGARDTLGLCLCVACVRIRSCRSTAANFRTSHAARSAQQIKTYPCGAQLKEDIESEEDAREICGYQLERIIVIIIVLVCVCGPKGRTQRETLLLLICYRRLRANLSGRRGI